MQHMPVLITSLQVHISAATQAGVLTSGSFVGHCQLLTGGVCGGRSLRALPAILFTEGSSLAFVLSLSWSVSTMLFHGHGSALKMSVDTPACCHIVLL